jgi:hypothetical protein
MKENTESLGNILFVKMKISKIINYSTNVCEIGKGIMGLHLFGGDMPFKLAHYINKKIELGSHHVS